MKLTTQRRIAATLLKCGKGRVTFDTARVNDIKEAITKSDMRLLISDGVVWSGQVVGSSRGRARAIKAQKRKGLRRGMGSRKGKASANVNTKRAWINRIRTQRAFLQELKEKSLVDLATYRSLYRKAKGGFFRSRRHIKLFLDDRRLWQKGVAAPKGIAEGAAAEVKAKKTAEPKAAQKAAPKRASAKAGEPKAPKPGKSTEQPTERAE